MLVIIGVVYFFWPEDSPPKFVDAPTAAPAPMPDSTATASPSPAPHPFSRTDTRTVRLDDQFDVIGSGSSADPYRITWPLLMSAQSGSNPDAPVRVPDYLKLLDGTWVEISGYLAPPVISERTRDLLVMRNRWDGCCIGTPPTPYDCIEVRLSEEVPVRGKHLIQFGSVRGVLHIEPFTAGNFLLGLYRIDQGEAQGFGG